jgi:hypothetical protein
MIDDDECGTVGGIRIGRGTEVLGECHSITNPTRPVLELGPLGWKVDH